MRDILYKFLSLFSIIRIFNVLVIITAQYLTAIFIISQEKTFESVLFDFNLFLLIICSSIAIASGYIINNFYDYEKDLINKPIKSKIDKIIRKRTKLRLYILLNFLCVSISYHVSIKSECLLTPTTESNFNSIKSLLLFFGSDFFLPNRI